MLTFKPSDCAWMLRASIKVVAFAMHSFLGRPESQAASAAWRACLSVAATLRPSRVRYAFREERASPSVGSRTVGIMCKFSGFGLERRRSLQRRFRSRACWISFWPKYALVGYKKGGCKI